MLLLRIIYKIIPKDFLLKKRNIKILFGINKGMYMRTGIYFSQIIGLYEKKIDKLIKKISFDPKRIFVLGIHNGYTALKFCNIFKNSKVIGVEADLSLCNDVRSTIKMNKINNLILESNTISYGDIQFYKSKNGMVYKSLLTSSNDDLTSSINPKIQLNELFKIYKPFENSILFIDIEGYEEDIFENEKIKIFEKFKLIIVEFHSNIIKEKIINFFKQSPSRYDQYILIKDIDKKNNQIGHLVIEKI